MKTKQFDLGDVLSITTGRLLSPRLIKGVYEILDWMTNDQNYTHQLPRVRNECKPWLLRWFPALVGIDCDELGLEGTIGEKGIHYGCKWFVRQISKMKGLPMRMDIPQIPQDDHERKDPYDELVIMRGTDEGIILVQQERADECNDR